MRRPASPAKVFAGTWRPSANAVCWLLLCGLVLAHCAFAEAPSDDPDQWKVAGEIYLWGASIGGSSPSGSEFEVDFDEIFDGLELAFMGNLTAQRNKFTLLTDVIYLNVSNSGSNAVSMPAGPSDPSFTLDGKVELKAWIINAVAGYNLIQDQKGRLDLLGGIRYLKLKPKVTVKSGNGGSLPGANDTVSDSGSGIDGVVGIRGHYNLSKRWYLPYYLDVGTGDSDVTYQAVGGLGYRFKAVDVFATYRYLKWRLDDNDVFDDLEIKGPMIGVRYTF